MSKVIKVVKIIDEYEVVINTGTAEGVSVDDTFEIYIPGDPIYDMDTKEFLGNLDFIKARIKVKKAFEKMSICRNSRTGATLANMASLLGAAGGSPLPLNVDTLDISGGFDDADPKIRVGDLVRRSF